MNGRRVLLGMALLSYGEICKKETRATSPRDHTQPKYSRFDQTGCVPGLKEAKRTKTCTNITLELVCFQKALALCVL